MLAGVQPSLKPAQDASFYILNGAEQKIKE